MRFVGFCMLMLVTHAIWATENKDWLSFNGYSGFIKGEDVHKAQWEPLDAYWKTASAELAMCMIARDNCDNLELTALSSEIMVLEEKSIKEQLRILNRYVNNDLGGAFDTPWRSSLNFTNEDVTSSSNAMMKYFLLRKLGFDAESLRVLTVQSRLTAQKENFLVVKLDKNYFLSDQFNTVLPQAKIIDLFVPSYAFNEKSMWMYVPNIQNIKEPANGK